VEPFKIKSAEEFMERRNGTWRDKQKSWTFKHRAVGLRMIESKLARNAVLKHDIEIEHEAKGPLPDGFPCGGECFDQHVGVESVFYARNEKDRVILIVENLTGLYEIRVLL